MAELNLTRPDKMGIRLGVGQWARLFYIVLAGVFLLQ